MRHHLGDMFLVVGTVRRFLGKIFGLDLSEGGQQKI
jgi:hypothetical protein